MIKKKYWPFLFCFAIAACVSDDVVRLQTDQSVEGEEIYQVSRVLDEHIYLVWQKFSDFQNRDSLNTLPDCPLVSINEEDREIVLDFAQSTCLEVPTKRKGIMTLRYPESPDQIGEEITVVYQNYTYEGYQVSGERVYRLVAQHRERRVFEDRASDLLITDPKASSTRVNFTFTHNLAESNGQTYQVTSTGTGHGRNHTGRSFDMEVTENKIFSSSCLDKQVFRPSSGSEKWAIERTTNRNVEHRLSFHTGEGCVTHTIVRLDEGVEMKKTP